MFKWENISKLWGLWGEKEENEQQIVDAQTWLDQNYPTWVHKVLCRSLSLGTKNEKNSNGLEVKLTGSLDLTGFTNLKKLGCGGNKITNLNLKDCSQLEELYCWGNELTELDMSNFPQLKRIGCASNKLTNLDCSNCEKLEYLSCWENQITKINFPSQLTNLEILGCSNNFLTDLDWAALPGEKLTGLNLENNNFPARDLSCLTRFTNLRELYLSNFDQLKISQGIYNRWTGSLQPLQNMKRLHTLDISNTDLDIYQLVLCKSGAHAF